LLPFPLPSILDGLLEELLPPGCVRCVILCGVLLLTYHLLGGVADGFSPFGRDWIIG